jgi:hypothetical protein
MPRDIHRHVESTMPDMLGMSFLITSRVERAQLQRAGPLSWPKPIQRHGVIYLTAACINFIAFQLALVVPTS